MFRTNDTNGNGTWFVRPSSGGADIVQEWGHSIDRLVPGKWDIDAKTDFAVFRPTTGTWHIKTSGPSPDIAMQFGSGGGDTIPYSINPVVPVRPGG